MYLTHHFQLNRIYNDRYYIKLLAKRNYKYKRYFSKGHFRSMDRIIDTRNSATYPVALIGMIIMLCLHSFVSL